LNSTNSSPNSTDCPHQLYLQPPLTAPLSSRKMQKSRNDSIPRLFWINTCKNASFLPVFLKIDKFMLKACLFAGFS
ncbi:hypothetical protein, partial [Paenibacillus ferrarius]|uniref:hypothetical protein n=1 Tax=Paenibacillus ferrarius TaxID=1469647 RepID=UPI003D2A97C0